MKHRTPQCPPHARVGRQGECRWLLVEWMHAPDDPSRRADRGRAPRSRSEVSRMQRECEAQVLRIALQHAILNNPETLDPEISTLPGRERARRFGGVGTPEVAEFAAAAL